MGGVFIGLVLATEAPLIYSISRHPSVNSCFSTTEGNTVLQGLAFGGVPVVLLLNFVFFLALLVVFSGIRKKLWDYGRLALVAENRESVSFIIHLIFLSCFADVANLFDVSHLSSMDMIRDRCGIDATHYLSFQRHLIFLLFIICVMSMAVILPVNLSGNLLGNDPYSFGRTTIGNLKEGDKLLWLHTVFAVLYLIFTILVLRHHTSQMKDVHSDIVSPLPVKNITAASAVAFTVSCVSCSEAYPTCNVLEVHLCYDVAKLIQHFQERVNKWEVSYAPHPNNIYWSVSKSVSHSCPFSTVQFLFHIQNEHDILFQLCVCIMYINNENFSVEILIYISWCLLVLVTILLSFDIFLVDWFPRENLSLQTAIWWIRCLGFNFVLFILLFFLTTPSIIITTMDKFNVTKPIYYLNSAVISQFLPTLLLWSFSALLPTIVYYSTLAESHWTRSSENISMMHKLYIFLLFMVLILPSLGLTSLDVFFRWLFDTKFLSQGKLRFECVFLPDQGAFFVNYVIAAALVGSGLELLRLPGLLLYTVRMALARSAAERKYIKQNQAYEFEYGAMYGWTLCVFTVIMAYSITCPVIVPFGILYMMLKHLVDKHNLFFAYLPACLDRQVHMGAVTQAWTAPILCLLWLYFFSVIRTGFKAETSLFTFVVLCVTVGVSIAYSCFGHFKYLSPHSYNVSTVVTFQFVILITIFFSP
uniref:Transmembrane protein 63A n=1 Tax=Scleropages formosus TaxID=113540 RepID=A0A8C9TXM6_SCLFO